MIFHSLLLSVCSIFRKKSSRLSIYFFSILFIFLLHANFVLGDPARVENTAIDKPGLSFLVIGDWGRNGYHNQRAVAVQMAIEAVGKGADFIISTGDNFYGVGVKSVTDKIWKTSFEYVYSFDPLMVPWHVVLGNHEYKGDVQAQIDYSTTSSRWRMPARYYTVVKAVDDSIQARFVFLDTNPFLDKSFRKYPEKNIAGQHKRQQIAWLDSVLNSTTARWNIVVGHHPIYSGGSRHGDTPELISDLKPILEKYKVQAYFCGHDHNLQHLKVNGEPIHYFVSGAGSRTRKAGKSEHTIFSKRVSGFASVVLDAEKMEVKFIDYKGRKIYSTLIKNMN